MAATNVPTAESVARYLLVLAHREPKGLTHLHIQKLLYFVQGWSLGVRGRQAFADPLEAWKHGAVAPGVYGVFKEYRDRPIPLSEAREDLDADDRAFVRAVWREYRGYSAEELREKNHSARSWREARGRAAPSESRRTPINVRVMAEEFRSEFERRCRDNRLDPVVIEAAIQQAERGELVPLNVALSHPANPRP